MHTGALRYGRLAFILPIAALGIGLSACGGDDSPAVPPSADGGTLDGNSSDGKAPDGKLDGAKLDGTSDADATPTVVSWHEATYPYRVQVTLKPHSTKDRVDVPVIATIGHPGASIKRNIRVYGKSSSGSYALIDGGAWGQPDGTVMEAGFTATGTTTAGESREFFVYYQTSTTPDPWTWGSSGTWSQWAAPDADSDGTPDTVALSGGGYAIQRDVAQDGKLLPGRRDDGLTFLKLTSTDSTIAEGFVSDYQLESQTSNFPASHAEALAPTQVTSDADAYSAAFAASWLARPAPVVHDAFLSYRVFAHYPFVESVLSATVGSEYRLSSADWSGRTLYLRESYDRMVSSTRGDEALEKKWDTSMRWLVVYNSTTGSAFGWFLQHAGVVRAEETDGKQTIYDSYGYSAEPSTALRYLWMASPSKDNVVTLFDAMQPGVSVGDPERKELNILTPQANDYYFPEDSLEVLVSTPGNTEPVTASLSLPNGTKFAVDLTKDANPGLWRSVKPLQLDATQPSGSWTLTATSAGVDATRPFEFRLPAHPKLLFAASELAAIQARKDDPAYATIWSSMLQMASKYDAPIPDPGPGKDIRSYADRLVNLALIQLVDPSQPYDKLLWDYFFAMLRYPNWESPDVPFNNLDLTVGHFLTALSITYDWHYGHLTAAERREVRARLRSITGAWVMTPNMATYRNIDWTHYGTVTNNHYWINHEGVAAATFVLADEMPDSVRKPWVDRTEENLAVILSVLEDDGASNEGVAYHSYGQVNLFQWLDMRDRALGGNSAQSIPWFAQSVQWDLYSLLPGGTDNYGGVANFGDCPPQHYQPPRTVQAWLANRLGDGAAQWTAQSIDRTDITAMSYLWYTPSVAPISPQTLPPFKLFPKKGIFAWRSSWGNDATYFSLKSGSYFGGHEQPDAGHFILHRGGVPYVTDHGYSYLKKTDEHNVIVVDDTDQYGGGKQWMESVDPKHWATVRSVVADSQYFDVVADPAPMVQAADMQGWKREVLAAHPDIFLVRDSIAAGSSHKLSWYLHSYKSTPPAGGATTYSYVERRTENPWMEVGVGAWSIQPQEASALLHVADISATSWTPLLEASHYVPETNPDTKAYNDPPESFQVGYRLNRQVQADHANSAVALWFGDDIAIESWTSSEAEAARFHKSGVDVVAVIWPSVGQVTGFHGFNVAGEMAGRRTDQLAYFGRALTLLSQGGTTLLEASTPVDLVARLEHSFSTSAPGVVVVRGDAQSTLKLRCETQPTTTKLDGATVATTWSGSVLTVSVPAGDHRIEVQ